jgi:Sec-independent protein translocase protein TatA
MEKLAQLQAARKAALERVHAAQTALETNTSSAALDARWEAGEAYREAAKACREYRKSLPEQEQEQEQENSTDAKDSFKKAYGFARKSLTELRYRSADINGSIDTDAFEYHLGDMMFGRLYEPLPTSTWSAICAVAHIMCQPDAQHSTLQERLQERKSAEDFYPYY